MVPWVETQAQNVYNIKASCSKKKLTPPIPMLVNGNKPKLHFSLHLQRLFLSPVFFFTMNAFYRSYLGDN